jgi:hypothetical protein
VIVDEIRHCINVREDACFGLDRRPEIVEGGAALEGVEEHEIEWIVECAGEGASVLRYVSDAVVERLSRDEDADCVLEICEDGFCDMASGVHTDALDVVGPDDVDDAIYNSGVNCGPRKSSTLSRESAEELMEIA